ncbi:MAG: phospho-N-acetylmuramoyl-pentapeptide-transferase [Patescibacteria group bacterium]|nr:phospho-N-acetylmuramoyl-pentapeptide-transferase [Patescibacteria group bacterium]
MTTIEALRIFTPATVTFLIGIGITPILTHFLYAYKMWKPKAGKVALDGTPAETFNRLHETKEVGTPRFGGIVVWMSVLITATLLSLLGAFYPEAFGQLAFISRNQTWVPLVAFIAGALVGLFDDLFEVQGKRGLRLRVRLLFVASVALLCAWWFYAKLGVTAISIPFDGQLSLGIWFIPCFILVALFVYAGGVIDGIDGLAGGVFSSIFAAYAGIAFFQHQMDIAALCAAVTGGTLAFLWFNIPPARFYLSETGTMGLSLLLTAVAFLTDTLGGGKGVAVLPIIALPLVATVASNILQVLWKKLLKRKLLRIAPLHHHFEALGWPPYKVTMRYWIVGVLCAIIGMSVALV